MKMIRHNEVWFRGQFGLALEKLLRGEVVALSDFSNGGWEATVKVKRFKLLLDMAEISYEDSGESLRTASIMLRE